MNFVTNDSNPNQPDVLSWIKLRGTGNVDASLRGIASNGFWGDSITGGNPAQNRLNVLAVAPVPVPAALPLFASALAGIGIFGRRKKA